jgi:hypothetical protein
MVTRLRAGTIALLFASVPGAGASEQEPVGLLPPVKTEIVRIDVVVTDKRGLPVSGLLLLFF